MRWNDRDARYLLDQLNRIGGVIVSVLASIVVDCEFESRSGQTKDYRIGMCCFSAKHAALRRKSKNRLDRDQDNMSEWGEMSVHGLLFPWAKTIQKSNSACWSSTKRTSSLFHWKLTCSRHDIQSMDISIRHPRFYAIYFISNHIFQNKYCEVISKRILIISAPEEAEIFKAYQKMLEKP